MTLALANFSATGDVYLMARLTAGGVDRGNGQHNVWSSSDWTNDAATGSLDEGSAQVSGLSVNTPTLSRIACWDRAGETDDRFILNAVGDADDSIGDIFTGATNMATLIHETSAGVVRQFSVGQRTGGGAGFVDWRGQQSGGVLEDAFPILSTIASGDSLIIAIHAGAASYTVPSTGWAAKYNGAAVTAAKYNGAAVTAAKYNGITVL